MEIEGETDICELADFIKFNPSTFFGGAITHSPTLHRQHNSPA